jgi:hypothetical protein
MLAVGIDPDSSYPAQVLSQLGVASVAVEGLKRAVADGVRVFVGERIGRDDQAWRPAAGQRVAIVTHHAALRSGAKRPEAQEVRSYRFQVPPQSPFEARSFFANLPLAPAEGESFGACHDRSGREIPNSGIAITETPGRLVVSLPWNVFGYRQGEQWEHRPYYSPASRKHFVEVGPLLDTGAFRRLLLEILLYCFDWAGLPLVRVSPRCRGKSCFSFRIDADGFSESSTQAALRVAEKTGLRFTWFLDMARWKGHSGWIARLKERGHDVQLHCYRHMTYASEEVNRINLRKGLALLEKSGVTANAVVSPLGYNYPGFAKVVKELGFAYSSEFGYAVDDLPSYPGNDRNSPLQIPIHPGCSGVFRHAGFTQEEQFRHLRDQVESICRSEGIAILYDHPVGGVEKHEAEYVRLFKDLKQNSFEYMGFSDVHRAWLARPDVPCLWYDAGRIEGDAFADNGFRLEQVTTGSVAAARWKGEELPQVRPAAGSDQFPHPPESIRELAVRNGRLNLRQRNFTPRKWHLNELYLELLDKSGYYRCRQALAQVKWLRSWARSMKRRKPPPQG